MDYIIPKQPHSSTPKCQTSPWSTVVLCKHCRSLGNTVTSHDRRCQWRAGIFLIYKKWVPDLRPYNWFKRPHFSGEGKERKEYKRGGISKGKREKKEMKRGKEGRKGKESKNTSFNNSRDWPCAFQSRCPKHWTIQTENLNPRYKRAPYERNARSPHIESDR